MNQILNAFKLDAPVASCERYGCGHVNETYLVVSESGRRYILQKISTRAFHDVPALMQNIISVTQFLKEKTDDPRGVLTLVPTTDDQLFLTHEDGSYWRLYDFVEDAVCLQAPETPEDFYQSALAFGNFQQMLTDFPAETLSETIPMFHNTANRFKLFREKLAEDPMGRAASVKAEIEFALAHEAEASTLVDLQASGQLPTRVTHNDTKLNNILIDRDTHEGICVIDLDTTMPGLSINDFGDSIRFGANHSAEDEKDLSKVNFDIELYEVFTRGFIQGAQGGLTPAELEYLPWGAKLMTLECGIRFLTDYLDGDHYFRIHYADQNLDRCRTQFKLVKDMEEQFEAMAAVVAKYAN